ncbi:MAG: fimbrillin family protein, partial [Bacteroidaceae bacterium]|nr:fimbrillin family protein [Bacteroidaceae bacterium]
DKVFIASPQCREGMNSGTFGVPSEADHRNYAGSFIKESGAIQWGSTDADFYSIYPQRENESEEVEEYQDYEVKTVDGFSATNATFQLNMPVTQNCVVEGTTPVMKTADMDACFMYARHTGVENGTSPVTLQYKPLSTAIRFILRGPENAGTVTVTRIRLIGPSGTALSGQFTVNLTGETPVVTPVSGHTSNIVTIYAKYANDAFLQLSNGQSIELNAFIIPQNGISINENWKLEVVLSTGKVCTKSLKPTATEANKKELVAGKIHRLGNMPYLPTVDLIPSRWMEFIPRNIYLSEISIPGSWNSMNIDCQGSNPSIATQYSNGVRLFHLDTRFRAPHNSVPTTSEYDWTLGVATGEDGIIGGGTWTLDYSGTQYDGKVQKKASCKDFSEYLTDITNNISTKEYLVLMCTFAQNSAIPLKRSSGPRYNWMEEISNACANNGKVYDAKQITANTTVGEVLGSVIVIVATEGAVSSITALNDSKCLFVQMPNERTSAMYP